MKKVTLFKVVCEDLMVESRDVVSIRAIPSMATPIRGCDELALTSGIKQYDLPIRKHMRHTELSREYLGLCGQGHLYQHPEEGYKTEETYIAIDPAAERVLDVEYSKMQSLETQISSLNQDIVGYRDQVRGLNRTINKFYTAGLWTRLKRLFTGVKP